MNEPSDYEEYECSELKKMYIKIFPNAKDRANKAIFTSLYSYFSNFGITYTLTDNGLIASGADIQRFINFYRNFNLSDYYSSHDVARILKINIKTISIEENKVFLKPIRFRNGYFFNKDIINTLLKVKHETITSKKLMEELNILTYEGLMSFIKDMQKKGFAIDVVDKKYAFWSKELLIMEYKDVLEYVKNKKKMRMIHVQKEEGLFNSNEYYNYDDLKYIYYQAFRKKCKQCKDNLITTLKKHFDFLNIHYFILNDNFFVLKEDVNKFIKFYSGFYPDDYYNFEEVNSLLGTARKTIDNNPQLIRKVYYLSGYYYNKSDVDGFVTLKSETMPSSELIKMYDITDYRTLLRFIEKLIEKGEQIEIITPQQHVFNEGYLVRGYQIVINNLDNKIALKNVNDNYEGFIKRINYIDISMSKIPLTLECFREFVLERHNSRSHFHKIITSYVRLYDYLAKGLKKEITQYNREEITAQIKKFKMMPDFNVTMKDELGYFLKFCKKKYPLSLLPNAQVASNTNRIRNSNGSYIAYTEKQWIDFAQILFPKIDDEGFRRNLALSRGKSMAWAYCAIHYIVAWRTDDICNIPSPNLSVIGFSSGKAFLEHIKNGGTFSYEMGDAICYSVFIKINGYGKDAGKNNKPLVFVVDDTMVGYIGFLLAVCEAHRQVIYTQKNKDTERIITKDFGRPRVHIKYFGDSYTAIFGDEGFLNLRAVKTLMRLLKKEGEKDSPAMGLFLPAAARPHAGTLGIPSNVTADPYLLGGLMSKDNDLNNITLNLIRRGVMSFAPYKILFAINNNFVNIDMEQQTQMIENLGLKASQIESISKAIIYTKNTIDSLISSVIKGERNTAKKALLNLFTEKSASKHVFVSCLLKALLSAIESENDGYSTIDTVLKNHQYLSEKCANPSSKTCFGCVFLVAEKYFLIELSQKIQDTVNRCDSALHIKDRTRYSTLLDKLKKLVREAITILGPERVKIYITKDILDSLETVESKDFQLRSKEDDINA